MMQPSRLGGEAGVARAEGRGPRPCRDSARQESRRIRDREDCGSMTVAISTSLSRAQMVAISARSDKPARPTRRNPRWRASSKTARRSDLALRESDLALRENVKEHVGYSTRSRDFSANPCGV